MTARALAVVSAGLSHPSATRLLAEMLTGFASPRLDAAIEAITSADRLIATTPIFTNLPTCGAGAQGFSPMGNFSAR